MMSLSAPDQATRNRSASTGPPSDLPEHEHKRPRLSQNNLGDNNSATKSTILNSSTNNHLSTPINHVQTNLNTMPRSPSPNTTLIPTTSPTSKVTINTRPLSAQSSDNPTIMTPPAVVEEQPIQIISSYPTSSHIESAPAKSEGNHNSEAISISSSDSSSPRPIEVAAPEDFGQDPADTEWETIAGGTSSPPAKIGPRWVHNTFPYASSLEVGSAHFVLQNMARVLESGTSGDGQLFLQVKDWLLLLVVRADSLDPFVVDNEFDFWKKLPNLPMSILRREAQPPTGVAIEDVVDFFVAWARLTAVVVTVDAERFRILAARGDGQGAEVAYAFDYLKAAYWSLQSTGTPFIKLLSELHEHGASVYLNSTIAQLRKSGGPALLRALSELFDTLVSFIPKKLQLLQQVFTVLQQTSGLVQVLLSGEQLPNVSPSELRLTQDAMLVEVQNFLSKVDDALEHATVKQHAWLSIDNCEQILKNFEGFVKSSLRFLPALASDIITAANIDMDGLTSDDLPVLAIHAWRFITLRKFMTKGRMELRVYAIGTMAEDLVKVFNNYIKGVSDPSSHPVVQLMSRLIRRNDLIRYIVGVDSHPQIISRSTNVVGFLCVSLTYSSEDTDVIWETALKCQDPRSGAEVLSVLKNNLDNLEYDAVRYIVGKLSGLTFENFNHAILDFAWHLMRSASNRINAISETTLDAQALNCLTARLCLRIARETHTNTAISSEMTERVRLWMPETLQMRFKPLNMATKLGVSTADLHKMMEELSASIRDHDNFACGSMVGVSNILHALDTQLLIDLVHRYDLTRLAVQSVVQFMHSGRLTQDQVAFRIGGECRLSVLPLLMLQAPDTFSDDLLSSIWEGLFSSRYPSEQMFNTAWVSLRRVCELSHVRNTVIDRIAKIFMPQLDAGDYNKAILDCMQQVIKYETRLNAPKPLEEGAVIVIPGIEQLWQVLLNAPPATVEVQAAESIISEYLDGPSIVQTPLASVEATHLAFIDRCVKQVTDAASYLKESDTIMDMSSEVDTGNSPTKEQYQLLLSFRRSLFLLRRFLDALKTKPRYSSVKSDMREILAQLEPQGDLLELTVQIHGHGLLDGKPQKWTLGQENKPSQLWQHISEITGWSQFNVIYGGRKVDWQTNTTTLSESKITPGMVMINKAAGSSEVAPSRGVRASSPVDTKIMNHFDELYHLLDLPNQLAKEVYEFLTIFSLPEEALDRLRHMSTPVEELLPVAKPYKLMYYLRALRSCVEDESFSKQPNTDFLKYAVEVMIITLAQHNRLVADPIVQSYITYGLMEILLLAFKAKVSEEISSAYFDNSSNFIVNIIDLWSQNMGAEHLTDTCLTTASIVRVPFEVVLEACLHDKRLWPQLPRDRVSDLLLHAISLQSSDEARQGILEVINNMTGTSSTKLILKLNDPRMPRMRFPQSSISDCLLFLWQEISSRVEAACEKPRTCQQFFEAMVSLLKTHGKSLESTTLQDYVTQWLRLLLRHRHEQEVGHPLQDSVTKYLGRLIFESFKLKSEILDHFSSDNDLVHEIFSLFLFPPLSSGTSGGHHTGPVLDLQTRQILYDLVIVLSRSTNGIEAITSELDSDLIPRDHFFQPNANNDRQALRSGVGYAGLRNLSNTCYLNSLFSQLFMNIEFRDLLLNLNIVDHKKQKLLVELGKVFAYMQNSYEDAVSPESAVEAITLWDGEQIDVAVQMDVDEFFNLLFDRIEFQILDPDVRSRFKSIYGGQLVQQIKSKECEHISERLEPFSAVQVEIKGQTCLEDSLRAYVEGEVLQGDNKYSCTGCGKHVDAVKRACLKDVPDHLIFNLKRFDYDILTGMRCKVNDEFQFPHSLDMTPYSLPASTNTESANVSDMFELVGVIIHSGTAESGHYYSYVRQRPESNSDDRIWAQFNDHDVSRFDPASIRDCCFGGIDYGAVQCPKFYNGYMLFYQRTSAIERAKVAYATGGGVHQVTVPIPAALEKHIGQQNELYLRSHVAQSAVHARFMRQYLALLPVFTSDRCSQYHDLETTVLGVVLEYVCQISARWKDLPEVEETLKDIAGSCAEQCSGCAMAVIRWFLRDSNLADNLIRSCYPAVRKALLWLLTTCWQSLADAENQVDLSEDQSDFEISLHEGTSERSPTYKTALNKFLDSLVISFDILQRHGRAWEQYFGLLSFLMKLGSTETEMIINKGFLEKALELIHVHVPQDINKKLRVKYTIYLLGRDRNRPHAPSNVIQFVAETLQHIDFTVPAPNPFTRATIVDKLGLTQAEENLMGFEVRPVKMRWLKKIILGDYNAPAMDTIVATLSKVKTLSSALGAVMRDGLSEPTITNAVYFLRPTLNFLSNAVVERTISEVVESALELIESTGGHYGYEFLSFVKSIETVENKELPFQRGSLSRFVYGTIAKWAPVLLIHPNDAYNDVRGDTLEFINTILFSAMDEYQRTDPDQYENLVQVARDLAEGCATFVQRNFLNPNRKEPMALQPGQANQILTVMESCLSLFGDTADAESRESRISAVIEELRQKSESLIETMSSTEWKDGSSDLEALSEVDLSELSP